ncbi:MAG TPA: hypothetical protein DEB24_08175 [Coriobacteriia bacterium]|nr:hypothetical protein [Coriobacteriia bacterium]
MNKKPLQHPERYQDPLGDHYKSVQSQQERRLGKYPDVGTVYGADYLTFKPLGKEGEQFLGSSDGVVGTTLEPRIVNGQPGFYAYDGRCIALFEDEALVEALEKGWKARCLLAYSVFKAEDKAITGTAVCFYYDPALGMDISAALEAFIGHLVDRICHRSYLKLKLSQDQFAKVIESRGEWFLIKEESWPKLPKGMVYYRRKRTLSDRMIDAANRGNKGCLVASWTGFFAIIAGIVLLVWFFFFR